MSRSIRTLDTQEELGLQFEFLEKNELGTFQVASTELKDHLEATRSIFALAHNTRGMHNHARWLLGDVLQTSGALHGDEYHQELDTFCELINWDNSKLSEVMRTSKTFWSSDMRKYSYDPHTWELVYKTEGGEHSPLEWNVYDVVSRNLGSLDDRAKDILTYIGWCQGFTHSKMKATIKLIEKEDPEYTDEIAKIGKMPPTEQFSYLADLKAKHKETIIRGNYLAFVIEDGTDGPELKVSRLADMDGYVLGKSQMVIHKTARELNLVTDFVDGKPVSSIIPTDEDFD